MKLRKVAIVTPGTFAIPSQRNSSVEKVVEQVCNRLKHKVSFTLFGKKERGMRAYEVRDGITYIRIFNRQRRGYLSSVNHWLKTIRPDIIQVENRPHTVSYLRQYHTSPIWLSLHSTRFMLPPHITLKELQCCLDAADKIIVNSHFLKNRIIHLYPSVKQKIAVNHLGVDVDQFKSRWTPEGEEKRNIQMQKLGYENKKIIMYAGRLIKEKGIHHILAAMPDIAADFPEAVLIIVGSAYYAKDILTPYVINLHQMGNALPSNVLFVPFQPYDLMGDWFRLADIVVVPSFEDEAFGLVNVEAMACGVPVLAARSGGMTEVIVDGQSGYLLEPSNLQEEIKRAIVLLLSNDHLRKTMGKAGAAHVRANFTWDRTAERMLELYGEAFDR